MSILAGDIFNFPSRLHFHWQIEKWGWEIGEHTYGKPQVITNELARLRIGRYTSIAANVTIVMANHRTDLVTTYPFRLCRHLWPEAATGEPDHEACGDVVIGHDVWIGTGSLILPGAVMGHGAVVAGRAVVRGTVPPYAIVAGNPARVVRYRFSGSIVERLLAIAWWDWDEALLRQKLPFMMSSNIDKFLDEAEKGDTSVAR